LWIMFVVSISYLIIKARNSSSSWLTVDSSNPASLYVDSNETLTAAKRNRLVQSTQRQEVPTSNTDPFDNNCERRWQGDFANDDLFYVDNIRTNWSVLYFYTLNTYYYLNNTSKGYTRIYWSTTTRTTLHIRKRCN